jgi:hypothetical protein
MKVKYAAKSAAALGPTDDVTAVGRRLNDLAPPDELDSKSACRGQARVRRGSKRAIVVAFLVPPALSFTAGCTSDANPAAETTAATPLHVAGVVVLVGRYVDFDVHSSGNECVGKGPFSDLLGGAEVRISDGSGQTLAMSRLGMGIADTTTTDLASGFCDFTFDASVPSGHGSYTIQVTQHGAQTFGEKQMATPKLYLA